MSYTIYVVQHVPEAMLAKYPTPALYAEGKLYLFGENLKEVSGSEPVSIVDIDAMGFNHPYVEGEEGLTAVTLNEYVDYLLNILGSDEVKLSKAQGQFLYETRFKPVSIGE